MQINFIERAWMRVSFTGYPPEPNFNRRENEKSFLSSRTSDGILNTSYQIGRVFRLTNLKNRKNDSDSEKEEKIADEQFYLIRCVRNECLLIVVLIAFEQLYQEARQICAVFFIHPLEFYTLRLIEYLWVSEHEDESSGQIRLRVYWCVCFVITLEPFDWSFSVN